MSDFLLTSLECDHLCDPTSSPLRWSERSRLFFGTSNNFRWIVSRADSSDLWSPAHDPHSDTYIFLVGRLALEEKKWKAAEKMPFTGGLCCRYLLNAWITNRGRFKKELNGAGLVCVYEGKNKKLHVITDRLGFVPCYYWTDKQNFCIGTHADIVRDTLVRNNIFLNIDWLSIAEFLKYGSSSPPYTYWQQLKHMESANHYEFVLRAQCTDISMARYWYPTALKTNQYIQSRPQIARRLAKSLSKAVELRTLKRLGKTALMLSSGADSRAILFGAKNPGSFSCIHFYDTQNSEYRGSKNLADIAGSPFLSYKRNPSYYLDHAKQAVRISGGTYSLQSAHFTDLEKLYVTNRLDNVLSGCYADYLFKGLAFNRKPITFLGKSIQLYKFDDFSLQFYLPSYLLSSEWDKSAELRNWGRFQSFDASLYKTTNWAKTFCELKRLTPIINEGDASGRLILRRLYGHDFVFSDTELIEIAFSMSPFEKLNGIPFGMAVSRITGNSANCIVNSNNSTSVGANEFTRVFQFLWASLLRKLKAFGASLLRKNIHPKHALSIAATDSSWPDYYNVVQHFPDKADWKIFIPSLYLPKISSIIGQERAGRCISEWPRDENDLYYRLLTIAIWLNIVTKQ